MLRTSAWGFAAAAALLAACGVDNGIVGGECAAGYVRCGHTCCAAPLEAGLGPNATDSGVDLLDASLDADPGADSGSDGGGGALDGSGDAALDPDADGGGGGGCVAPLVYCGNACVDLDNDPMNCGSCGKVCPSNSCANGMCQGNAAGHVIAVGHDFVIAPQQCSSQARVVSNAVLLPLSNPVRVLSYERYASAQAVANVKSIVSAAAKLLGRKVTFTSTTLDAAVPAMLDINAYDVLLVPDQPMAASNDLAGLGAGWKQSQKLDDFLHGGGVIVALDGGGGVDEMPAFLGAAGLLATNGDTPASGALTVTAPNDGVGLGVISPYVPTANTVTLDTEPAGGNVVYVVSKQAAPVVVHKVVP